MRVLIVDDELSMREYLELLLSRAGYEVMTSASVPEASARLSEGAVDLVISDMKLGNESGLTVLKEARALPSAPEVILITAYGTPASAVEAMRAGAYDYIAKPFDNEELKLLVQKALEKRALRQELSALRSTLGTGAGRALLGKSARMEEIWTLIEKVAPARSTVLISGESGTGKELVARAIHYRSPRANQPFIPLNCAAVAEGLLESELFGHIKGAFTGALQDRPGILVTAGEGTVFLDEIGEIPAATQVKLLRVLQERRLKPVGSATEVEFKARILAASNRNLEEEVRAGRFREDLLYRLNVISIEVPPLRERVEDIGLLAEHFLGRMREELGRPELRFSTEALEALSRFSYPGNVRQLQNIVERAATLADTDELGLSSLPPVVRGQTEELPKVGEVMLGPDFSLERQLDALEREYLLAALDQTGGVKTRAAEVLGLTFRSFRYRLAKHGLADPDDLGRRGK